MSNSTLLTRRTLLAGTAAMLAVPGVRAATYPARPVRVIVPFAPAGPTDIMARILTNHLGSRLNGSFIVDNQAGAGGNRHRVRRSRGAGRLHAADRFQRVRGEPEPV